MQRDYPELEGTEAINMFNVNCIVAGCNYDVGITCVEKDNTDNEVFCINGPSSPHYDEHCKGWCDYHEKYSELFYRTIELLKKGIVIDNEELDKIVNNRYRSGYGELLCAYKG